MIPIRRGGLEKTKRNQATIMEAITQKQKLGD